MIPIYTPITCSLFNIYNCQAVIGHEYSYNISALFQNGAFDDKQRQSYPQTISIMLLPQ